MRVELGAVPCQASPNLCIVTAVRSLVPGLRTGSRPVVPVQVVGASGTAAGWCRPKSFWRTVESRRSRFRTLLAAEDWDLDDRGYKLGGRTRCVGGPTASERLARSSKVGFTGPVQPPTGRAAPWTSHPGSTDTDMRPPGQRQHRAGPPTTVLDRKTSTAPATGGSGGPRRLLRKLAVPPQAVQDRDRVWLGPRRLRGPTCRLSGRTVAVGSFPMVDSGVGAVAMSTGMDAGRLHPNGLGVEAGQSHANAIAPRAGLAGAERPVHAWPQRPAGHFVG